MIKFKQGKIRNMEGVEKDIIVKAAGANKLKDIVIGGGLMLMGITYLTFTAFKNAEYDTMIDLGIIQ